MKVSRSIISGHQNHITVKGKCIYFQWVSGASKERVFSANYKLIGI